MRFLRSALDGFLLKLLMKAMLEASVGTERPLSKMQLRKAEVFIVWLDHCGVKHTRMTTDSSTVLITSWGGDGEYDCRET